MAILDRTCCIIVNIYCAYNRPFIGPLANFCFSVAKLCGFFKKRAAQKPKMLPIFTVRTFEAHVRAIQILTCFLCGNMMQEIKNDPIAERRK